MCLNKTSNLYQKKRQVISMAYELAKTAEMFRGHPNSNHQADLNGFDGHQTVRLGGHLEGQTSKLKHARKENVSQIFQKCQETNNMTLKFNYKS